VKNLGTMDRIVRAFLAELCILIAFFWMGRDWQIVLYLLAFVLVFQAATGVCGFYSLIGRNSCERIKRKDKNLIVGTIVLMVFVAGAGSYASGLVTKNILMDDIRSIEKLYNLTLSSTEKNQWNESIEGYELMNKSFVVFNKKYTDYRPLALKFDEKFQGDMQNFSIAVKSSRQDIYTGHLSDAHSILAAAGPILQGIKERDDLG
jgi:hypothetical protein